MRPKIKLGDMVQCTITGFEGVAVCVSNWLYGCQRVTVQPKELRERKPVEMQTFDAEQLAVVTPATPAETTPTGGPPIAPTRNADPR